VSVVELLGWAGNACFFSRFLVQWAASERARRSVATPLFWWLSLAGSLALGIYTLERAEPVLLAGYVLNGAVYARNLLLQRRGAREPRPARPFAVLVLLGAAALTASVLVALPHGQASAGWIACAALGQAIWSGRFLYQWWWSERAGRSLLPEGFWWLSLAGNVLLLAYALHLRDAVLVAGYAIGPLVQVRNLILGTRSAAGSRARAA
jgi:lipid-A-disaccharide synthase-like uncharacterized protein